MTNWVVMTVLWQMQSLTGLLMTVIASTSSRTSDFQISGSAISSHKNIHPCFAYVVAIAILLR